MLSFGFQSHKQKLFRFRIPYYIKVRYNRQGKREICFAAKRVEQSVFTHVASIYANLLEQKKSFAYEKSSTPTGLVWDIAWPPFHCFGKSNMAAVTSCENTLQRFYLFNRPRIKSVLQQISLLPVAESREQFYFFQENLYKLRVLPAQGKRVLQQVTCNTHVKRDSRVIFSSQNPICTQLAPT